MIHESNTGQEMMTLYHSPIPSSLRWWINQLNKAACCILYFYIVCNEIYEIYHLRSYDFLYLYTVWLAISDCREGKSDTSYVPTVPTVMWSEHFTRFILCNPHSLFIDLNNFVWSFFIYFNTLFIMYLIDLLGWLQCKRYTYLFLCNCILLKFSQSPLIRYFTCCKIIKVSNIEQWI